MIARFFSLVLETNDLCVPVYWSKRNVCANVQNPSFEIVGYYLFMGFMKPNPRTRSGATKSFCHVLSVSDFNVALLQVDHVCLRISAGRSWDVLEWISSGCQNVYSDFPFVLSTEAHYLSRYIVVPINVVPDTPQYVLGITPNLLVRDQIPNSAGPDIPRLLTFVTTIRRCAKNHCFPDANFANVGEMNILLGFRHNDPASRNTKGILSFQPHLDVVVRDGVS